MKCENENKDEDEISNADSSPKKNKDRKRKNSKYINIYSFAIIIRKNFSMDLISFSKNDFDIGN